MARRNDDYCRNCKFWLKEDSTCRAVPPQIIVNRMGVPLSQFPKVEPGWYCWLHDLKQPIASDYETPLEHTLSGKQLLLKAMIWIGAVSWLWVIVQLILF